MSNIDNLLIVMAVVVFGVVSTCYLAEAVGQWTKSWQCYALVVLIGGMLTVFALKPALTFIRSL